MILIDRRSLLVALGAVSFAGCDKAALTLTPGHSLQKGLDSDSITKISQSYLNATNDPMTRAEIRHLFKSGEISLAALKSAVKLDFENSRIFKHKGWILSHTEGKLFSLLSDLS